MSQTNVDDILIEMITPKVKEIEERFSRGEGLSNEDINTLLLKSQYNHINHLDRRLDEVTASVRALEGKFQGLEGKFDLLKAEVNGRLDAFDGRLDAFDGRFDAFEGRLEAFEKRIELKISEAINTNMRWSIGMIALIVTVLKLADMFTK